MNKGKPMSVVIELDPETKKWFNNNPSAQTTVACCNTCGIWYKPELGHQCKNGV